MPGQVGRGLGSAGAETLLEAGVPVRFARVGVRDTRRRRLFWIR